MAPATDLNQHRFPLNNGTGQIPALYGGPRPINRESCSARTTIGSDGCVVRRSLSGHRRCFAY